MTNVVARSSGRRMNDRSTKNITSTCVSVLSMGFLHFLMDDGKLVGGIACCASAGKCERAEEDRSNHSARVAA